MKPRDNSSPLSFIIGLAFASLFLFFVGLAAISLVSEADAAEFTVQENIEQYASCAALANIANLQLDLKDYLNKLEPYKNSDAKSIAYFIGKMEGTVEAVSIMTGRSPQELATDGFNKMCTKQA